MTEHLDDGEGVQITIGFSRAKVACVIEAEPAPRPCR